MHHPLGIEKHRVQLNQEWIQAIVLQAEFNENTFLSLRLFFEYETSHNFYQLQNEMMWLIK